MMRHTFRNILVLTGLLLLPAVQTRASLTVASFADPSQSSTEPLFMVNFTENFVAGGWADGLGNLHLAVPHIGAIFPNAWFEMDRLDIVSVEHVFGVPHGRTSAGQIRFYRPGTDTDPLMVIDFAQAFVSQTAGLTSMDFFGQQVEFGGSQISRDLFDKQFSFSFANTEQLAQADGFTATAAFTSSAIPEPATIALLAVGAMLAFKRTSGTR